MVGGLKLGSGGRARTYDMVVNSHPLCQLSYAGTNSADQLQAQKIDAPAADVKAPDLLPAAQSA